MTNNRILSVIALRITKTLAILILTNGQSVAQTEKLEIELEDNTAILTWPGDELLFSSPTLQNFTLIEGAQSPFEQSITESEQLFFQLRTLPEVLLPIDGSIVGTELINVQGLIGSVLANAPELSVTINGQNAQIDTNSDGETIFALNDFDLAVGSNTLAVVFTTSAGVQQTQNLNITYLPVTASNVTIVGDFAYAAQEESGVAIVNLETRSRTTLTVGNTTPAVDDLSFDGNFLFTLNTSSTTQTLSVYSLENPTLPALVSGPISAGTGFFSGVSAAEGRVAIAGGISPFVVRNYNPTTGVLSTLSSSSNLSVIGRPDVLLSADGELAHVSVDFTSAPNPPNGLRFGLVTVNLNDPPANSTNGPAFSLTNLDNSFGLSSGGQSPANFPVESALAGNRLLVTSGTNLAILSSDGSSFQSNLPLGFFSVNVDGDDTTAFVVGSQNETPTLAEIDFSNPNSPAIVSTTSFPGAGLFTGVSVNEDYVAIAANNGSLRILNRN